MPYQPTTNFNDSNGVDLGEKLITKDYLLTVYGSLLNTLAPGLSPTPTLWLWGENSNGELGINDTNSRSTPVTTLLGGTNWKVLKACANYSAAIKTDGTLWLWGVNTFGQLGVNDTTSRLTPVTTMLGGNDWKTINFNGNNVLAIKTDGSLWTWGRNQNGQLGVNDIVGRSTPVTTLLGGNDWKTTGGAGSAAAIKTDGSLWVWGSNAYGQLGINDNANRSTPVTTILGGNDWKSVSSRNLTMSAIKTDGTLWAWGRNFFGQLGVNDRTDRSTPVTTILGGNNWKIALNGNNYIMSVKTDGTLWCWGEGTLGQLGINSATNRSTPVTTLLGGTNWKYCDGGVTHSTAIKTDGSLWTWGLNSSGQLGVNDLTNRLTPVTTLLGGNNWKAVSCLNNGIATIQSLDYI